MGSQVAIGGGGMQCIGGYLSHARTAPKGGIVVVQEIFGVNSHIRSVVDQFAASGYTAIAPAFFDHLETGVELDYTTAGIARGRDLTSALEVEMVMADVVGAADTIRSAGPIAVVGYCWGGTVALLAAGRLGMPAVSYYGARNVAYLDEGTRAPVQFHFGERDSSIPTQAIQRHRDALPDSEIFVYPASHGFNCDARDDYDEASAALAYQRTLDFLQRTLGAGS
ncbi:dienelactone hydrolase family protein [Dokdonella sp.]|uniref:dienelactone hydrolase family protein n=1 Tax=Dokdonella sp. TaxID=2291710 RepID=UPI003C6140BA